MPLAAAASVGAAGVSLAVAKVTAARATTTSKLWLAIVA